MGSEKLDQLFADRYPLVEPSVAPGRFVPHPSIPDRQKWVGLRRWRTQHGPARVRWERGHPIFVENALYPDGSRGEAVIGEKESWRRSDVGSVVLPGNVEIRAEDVVFTDSETRLARRLRQPPSQDALRASWEARHPVIEQGAEPPGRYVSDPNKSGRQRWEGNVGWRTRHGPAIVRWSRGEPEHVENAVYPGGSRGEAMRSGRGWRRRSHNGEDWTPGTLDIRPDDVTFTDGEEDEVTKWARRVRGGKPLSNQEQRAYIDEHYPFADPNADPPGRMVPSPLSRGLQQWQGAHGWRTRHGAAIVRWSRGHADRVEGAVYPDGSRGEVERTVDRGWRRRVVAGPGWLYGEVEIGRDDVRFIDGDQPVYSPPPLTAAPNLEADLARDSAFLAALKDDRFAHAVYSVFNNRTFVRDHGGSWSCGQRQAGQLIADLRGLGESYNDYFPWSGLAGCYPDDRPQRERALRSLRASQPGSAAGIGNDKWLAAIEALDANRDVFESLRGHLTRLGWRTQSEADLKEAEEQALWEREDILDELEILEERPEASPGAWVSRYPQVRKTMAGAMVVLSFDALRSMRADPSVLMARLYALARGGRISEHEFEQFRLRIAASTSNG